jgi:hypothetical protein
MKSDGRRILFLRSSSPLDEFAIMVSYKLSFEIFMILDVNVIILSI